MIASALEHSDGIFYSDDWGMNWKRIDTKDRKLASSRVWTLLYDPNNPNRILAGTHSSGIYRIEKIGATIKADKETPSDTTTRPRVAANGN